MNNNFLNHLKKIYFDGNIIIKLIFINIIIFILSSIIGFFLSLLDFSYTIKNLFGLSSSLLNLGWKPWSILSYSWIHGSLMHIGINIILLYVFGQLFLSYFRDKNLLTFYLFGGISGGVFYLLFTNTFSYTELLIGASASIYAIIFGLISYNPKIMITGFPIPITFPILYFGYLLIGLDLYNIISINNAGGSFSHFGGICFGYLYMKQFQKGNDFLGAVLDKILSFLNQKKTYNKPIFKTHSANKTVKNKFTNDEQKIEKQNKMNAILDKISRSGYESLSKEEKDFLFKEGR